MILIQAFGLTDEVLTTDLCVKRRSRESIIFENLSGLNYLSSKLLTFRIWKRKRGDVLAIAFHHGSKFYQVSIT